MKRSSTRHAPTSSPKASRPTRRPSWRRKAKGNEPAGVGNPTEVALLLWLQGRGRDYMALRSQARVLDQLTFSTERKYMATLVESPVAGSRVLYVKGAPEIVMSRCTLDEARKREYEEALLAYQNKAMRTLGLAYKVIPADAPTDCAELVAAGGLTFLGIFAISDPIRPDVPDAVRQCQSAGIAVKIVTGDTPGHGNRNSPPNRALDTGGHRPATASREPNSPR